MADASKITMTQGDAPSTPAAGTVILYSKTGGGYYYKGADGVEHTWYETGGLSPIGVEDGGSGTSTLTDHGVLVGSGTDPITALGAMTDGQLVIGKTGADPVVASITDGEGIDTTAGAGTLTIACEDATDSNKGVVELATTTEATTGTDTARAVTPAGSAAALANLKTHDCENVVEDLSWLPPVTFTWDPGSLDDGVGETSSAIAVPGAVLGSTIVQCVAPYDLQGITCNAWVDAANSCKARLQNETTGTINLASGTWVMQGRRI